MAKSLKLKMPKRIAGLKIPKRIRKGPVSAFLNSSGGQVVLAECLLFAAGALAAKATDPTSTTGATLRHPIRGAKRAVATAALGGKRARELMTDRSSRVAYAFSEAAQAFRAAMQQSDDEVGRTDAAQIAEGEDSASIADEDGAKKKRSASSSDALGSPH